MLIIGLTGGIASGKSAVTDLFRARGVTVYDADVIARAQLQPATPAFAATVAAFGDAILDASGAIDRRRLRALIFQDPARRRQLEQIIHPRVRAELQRLLAACPGPYCLVCIPLLVETGMQDLVQRVLVVDVDEQRQLERLTRRDGVPLAEAQAALAAQASRQRRLAAADDVIDNNGDPAALTAQVDRLHQLYQRLAASH